MNKVELKSANRALKIIISSCILLCLLGIFLIRFYSQYEVIGMTILIPSLIIGLIATVVCLRNLRLSSRGELIELKKINFKFTGFRVLLFFLGNFLYKFFIDSNQDTLKALIFSLITTTIWSVAMLFVQRYYCSDEIDKLKTFQNSSE